MENPDEPSLFQRLLWLGIALLIVGTIVVYLALPIISWRWTQLPFPELLFEHTLIVGGVRPQDREAELSGDNLLHLFAVGDHRVYDGADLRHILQDLSPGDSLTLYFDRRGGGDEVYTRQVTLVEFPMSDWATLFWLPYAVGLVYLIMAVWVFYHRGRQGVGQSFALCCLAVALSTGVVFDLNSTHLFTWMWTATLPLVGAALVHLGLVFPEPLPLIRRRRALRYIPYALAAVLILVAELNLYRPGDPWAYIAPWRWGYIAMGLALIAFLGLMLSAWARTVSEIVRKQVRLILVGSALAFGPLFVFMLLAGLAGGTSFLPALYLPPLVLFPLFIAYAILRYKLLGIDLVLSRGLAYTLLTAAVAAAYFLALTVLGQLLGFQVASHPLVAAVLVIILIFILEPLREGSEQLADRLLDRSRVNYRQSLQGFSRELASTPLGLSALLDRLESHIEPMAHSAPILIFLYDPMMGRYTLRRASRFVVPEEGEITFAQDGPLVRHLARQDGPLYLLDESAQLPEGEHKKDEQAKVDSLGMVLFLPLRGKGEDRLGGWVALGPRLSGEPYSPDDLNFLAALVDQATIAIENARLLDSLEQQLVRLDVLRQISEAVDLRQDLEDLLDLIYQQTCRVVEVDNFYVALYDASRQEFNMAFYVEEGHRREPQTQHWPLGTGLTSQIVRNGRPLVTDDYLAEVQRRGVPASGRPAKAWLGVPLKAGVGGDVLGVLNVSSFRQDYRYTDEQMQLMQAIGDQAAMAIDRMHLYREMEVRAAELATLNEINRTINSTLDLPSVLDLIMTKVVELLDVEAGSLLLVDGESDDLIFQVALGGTDSDDLVGRRHPAGKGIIGHVAASGQAQIVNDVEHEPSWDQEVDQEIGFVTRQILCVPMISRDQVVGVIEVINHHDGTPFRVDEADLLTNFAGQAAVAIENARLYTQTDQALARRVEELSTMQRIDRELNAALDFDRVMGMTLDWALRATGAPVGIIALYDEEQDGLLLLASHGYPESVERYRHEPWPLTDGIVGRVVRTGEPALVGDVTQDRDYWPFLPASHAQLSVPIRREEGVIGVVTLESPELGAFDEENLAFVQRLADHAAIAIENARLHAETEQRLQEQVALRTAGEVISSALELDVVLSHIAEQMARTVDTTSAYICDYDPGSGNSTVIAEFISTDASPRERISDLGAVYPQDEDEFLNTLGERDYDVSYIDDPGLNDQERQHMEEYGAKTILYIPFRIRGQVIGIAELWESRHKRIFTGDEIALCQGIAHQAAIAIENARLYQESRRRAEDMALLYQVSLTISSHLALDQVLEAIYAQMRRVWDPPVFFIALYDAAEDALDFPIYVDRGERLAPFRQRLVEKTGFSAWIVRNRQPLLIRDWQKEAKTSSVQGIPIGDLTRSWLGVPLLVGEQVVGVMSVQDYAPAAFGEEHERFLSTIASEVVIAIENARLYQQSEAYAQELAARAERLALVNRISTAVNSTLDLDEILQTATRQMAQAFQVKQAGTVLLEGESGYGRLVAEYRERGDSGGELRIPVRGNRSMERVILTREPLVIADVNSDPTTEGIRDVLQTRNIYSMLIVPLVVQDKVIGTIGLDAIDGPRAFTPDEVDLAQTIANQVSLAVENVRLYQETQQRLREVTLLFDTSSAVSKTLDLDRVLQTTTEQIAAALDADGCTIAIWDQEENALITQLAYSTDPEALQPEAPGTRYFLEEHPTLCRVLEERQTVVLQAGDAGADVAATAWMAERRAGSALLVPMIARDKAFGVLELIQAGEARKFTANEIRLCQTLANQAAGAIDNARLYEGVRQADQAKSEFIDFVAHELKQPMTAMQGYAKMLTMGIGGELTATQNQFVNVITSNVDRMGKLVNDLLEISRLEAGRTTLKLAPVDLALVVQETVTNTRTEIEARHHTLEVETPDGVPPVMGDRVRLVQILTNLVSNAYKYTPQGGLIRIAINGQDRPEVPPGHVCVSVSDTGIGMSPEELSNLEEKFFRADHDLVQQQPGTGLGVSITRNLVTLHGGEFFIESEPGKGSTFHFTVPVAGPEGTA